MNDRPAYRRLCPRLISGHLQDDNPLRRNNAIWQAALVPDAVSSYGELLAAARSLMDRKDAGEAYFNTYGALLYRAHRDPSAITFLKRSIDAQKGQGNAFDWAFLAMALHRQAQPGAREALDRARSLAKPIAEVWTRVEIDALLEEARQELGLPRGTMDRDPETGPQPVPNPGAN